MRKWSLALLLTASLLFTGCSNGNSAHTAAGAHADVPTLDVKLSVSGNQASVKLETSLHIAPDKHGQERVHGEGHIHMYLDNGEKIVVDQLEQTFKDLTVGRHTIKVSLHNNDHTPYDVTKTLEFDIK